MDDDFIRIVGANSHNLKDISLSLPRGKFTVVTGPSGSGKSALVFGTIQRVAEQQVLAAMLGAGNLTTDADCAQVSGLSFTVAFKPQLRRGHKSKLVSLVGANEVLACLFLNLAQQHCLKCGARLTKSNELNIIERFEKSFGEEVSVLAPLVTDPPNEVKEQRARLSHLGLTRVFTPAGEMLLDDLDEVPQTELFTVVDRFTAREENKNRLLEAIQIATQISDGAAVVAFPAQEMFWLASRLRCNTCHSLTPSINIESFSYLRSARYVASKELLIAEFLEVSLQEWLSRPVSELHTLLQSRADKVLSSCSPTIARVYHELTSRLSYLNQVGLGYLQLGREVETLSSGELNRAQLAEKLGSPLIGVLYLLDEPTLGLHPQDAKKLVFALKAIRDLGNSIVVVDHEREIINSADLIVELGPGSGDSGGEIIARGAPQEFCKLHTRTSRLLKNELDPLPQIKARECDQKLILRGISCHNVQIEKLNIPLGKFTAVTGVSGSGKSTLVFDCLAEELTNKLIGASQPIRESARIKQILGSDDILRVVNSTESPFFLSRNSALITAVDALGHIRKLFSETPTARIVGLSPGHFSFNTDEGACEECGGNGVREIELERFPAFTFSCPRCNGGRYNERVANIRYRGKTIVDVLKLTVEQAVEFFANHRQIVRPFQLLSEVGLSYLVLGQPASSLSHGERQRVKLVADIGRGNAEKVLYLFDEPSRGLHRSEMNVIAKLFQELIDGGGTVIAIEHCAELIRAANYIVELGPGAGKEGGRVMRSEHQSN